MAFRVGARHQVVDDVRPVKVGRKWVDLVPCELDEEVHGCNSHREVVVCVLGSTPFFLRVHKLFCKIKLGRW